jgi:hypothetical protein
MEQNIKQIKESPLSLVRGVFRAYEETLKKGFLFRFGPEKRLASTGMAMFILALVGCWFWNPLRRDAIWIMLLVAGIIASIPFAPPWDAGLRPYAASVPVQIFLAAAGVAMLLDLLRRLAEVVVTGELAGFLRENRNGGQDPDGLSSSTSGLDENRGMGILPMQGNNRMGRMPMPHALSKQAGRLFSVVKDSPGLIGFSVLCFVLVLPAPLILKMAGYRHPAPSEAHALLPGSRLLVASDGPSQLGRTTRAHFLDRLSEFQASYPEEVKFFTSQPGDFVLAVDWSNLETVVLPFPDGPNRVVPPIHGQ